MAEYCGTMQKPVGKFAIVAAEFNRFVVERLVDGARGAFLRHGVDADDIDAFWTPGALEIGFVARRLALSGQYVAIVAAGCVIRGSTSHYDVVVRESAAAVRSTSLETDVPILNAILTTENMEQALDRAGGKAGNKGYDAACSAIAMANLLNSLPK